MADPVPGSAQRVPLVEDTNSIVVHEVVDQLNKAGVQYPVVISESIGGGGTARALLGAWGVDTFIRDMLVGNVQNNALVAAGTRIRFRKAKLTDMNLVAGPSTPEEVLDLNGFNTNNYPAKTGQFTDDIVATGSGATVNTKTGSGKGVIVKKDEFLYVEFTNSEGAARALQIILSVASTDFLDLGPNSTQARPRRQQRDFNRRSRKATDQ